MFEFECVFSVYLLVCPRITANAVTLIVSTVANEELKIVNCLYGFCTNAKILYFNWSIQKIHFNLYYRFFALSRSIWFEFSHGLLWWRTFLCRYWVLILQMHVSKWATNYVMRNNKSFCFFQIYVIIIVCSAMEKCDWIKLSDADEFM